MVKMSHVDLGTIYMKIPTTVFVGEVTTIFRIGEDGRTTLSTVLTPGEAGRMVPRAQLESLTEKVKRGARAVPL